MNQEEDECSFGKTRKYFSSGLQPASMGKLWGAVRKKSATLNLDKHIENPSACSLGNAVFGLCLQKALWLLSESWGRGGSCFQGWACGWEDLWCLVLASPIWCCLLTPAGMGVRSSEMKELFIYVLPEISKLPERKPLLTKADMYWSCGSKALGFWSFSEHLGFSLCRSSQLTLFNNKVPACAWAWQPSAIFKLESGGPGGQVLDQTKPLEVFLCLSVGINSAVLCVHFRAHGQWIESTVSPL